MNKGPLLALALAFAPLPTPVLAQDVQTASIGTSQCNNTSLGYRDHLLACVPIGLGVLQQDQWASSAFSNQIREIQNQVDALRTGQTDEVCFAMGVSRAMAEIKSLGESTYLSGGMSQDIEIVIGDMAWVTQQASQGHQVRFSDDFFSEVPESDKRPVLTKRRCGMALTS